jgi:hypothetical protein
MPRFGIKSALIAIAVIAVWLSTFKGYSGGRDVRACIVLTIALASFLAVIYFRGRRQAFWIGFLVSIVVMQLPLSPHYKLNGSSLKNSFAARNRGCIAVIIALEFARFLFLGSQKLAKNETESSHSAV